MSEHPRGKWMAAPVAALVMGAFLPSGLRAEPGDKPASPTSPPAAGEPQAPGPDDAGGAPSPHELNKIRPGSLLRRNQPLADLVDLRGDFEKRRDQEIIRHYTRLAELDVIDAVAKQANDTRLLDRVEDVRRKEQQRFWMVMQYLRDAAQEKAMLGNR